MSDDDKKKLEHLQDSYYELYTKESRERKHRRYFHIGSIIGITFMFISTPFENEFYSFFGTLGMGLIQGVTGLCFLMSVIFILPGVRAESNAKWQEVEEQRKEIERLRKKIK